MDLREQDQDLLEHWLDGELSDEQSDALRERLNRDPTLTAELERLRGDRQRRESFWQVCQPSSDEFDACLCSVRDGVALHIRQSYRMRWLRNSAGVAAALVLVFTSGWISRSQLQQPGGEQAAGFGFTPVFNRDLGASEPERVINTQRFPMFPPSGFTLARQPDVSSSGNLMVNLPVDANGMSRVRPVYRLVLIDPMGTPISVQQLDNVEDHAKVSAQLADFQTRLEAGRSPAIGGR